MLQQRAPALRCVPPKQSPPQLLCLRPLMQCLRRPLTCTITSTIPEHLLHPDLPDSAIMSKCKLWQARKVPGMKPPPYSSRDCGCSDHRIPPVDAAGL